jgi:hypothetical protein
LSGGRRARVRGVLAAAAACAFLLAAAPSASADTFTVTNTADTGGTCPTPSACTLRQAINDAEGNGNEPTADLIQITATGNIDVTTFLPDITTSMTITGPGASSLHVRRPSSAVTNYAIFLVDPAANNTVTIEDLTITGGSAGSGGGIQKGGTGTLIVDSVVLSDNHAPGGSGGAIRYSQGFTSIRNSTLVDNDADFGGALLGDVGGDAELVNSTLHGNRATSFGGGVYSNGGIEILSSTIQGNTANSDDDTTGDGGGIYTGADGTDFSVANSLLTGNVVGFSSPVPEQCGSPVTSFGYNLSETDDSTAGCDGFVATGDFVNSNAALLGSLGGTGSTPTSALLTGNPAIDAGNPATPGSGAFPICPATDQRGLARGGGAGRCDIGAFEVNAGTGAGGGGTTTPPGTTAPIPGATGLRAKAIKKCKKKPKGKKRKKCIKRAKRLPV